MEPRSDPRHSAGASLKHEPEGLHEDGRLSDPRHSAGASLKHQCRRRPGITRDRDPRHSAGASLKQDLFKYMLTIDVEVIPGIQPGPH